MFHHLHGGQFKAGEGSLAADDFARILDQYGDRVLGAEEWTARRRKGALSPEHVCITFDDCLLCQRDIALPILEERGLTALWYVYSTALDGTAEGFEIARHFRVSAFEGPPQFFEVFRATSFAMFPELVHAALETFKPKEYLTAWSFYSDDERTYRYLRDRVLGESKMLKVLARMMADRGFSPISERHKLWMTRNDVKALANAGHVVGLHSTTHPMTMATLPEDIQKKEYDTNLADIEAITGVHPFSMAHPCNSYSKATLDVLNSIGC